MYLHVQTSYTTLFYFELCVNVVWGGVCAHEHSAQRGQRHQIPYEQSRNFGQL